MKIVYLAKSAIPSREANSIHVMKMCNAIASNGHDLTLITHDWAGFERNEKNIDDIDKFYGTKKNGFRILFQAIPKFKGRGVWASFIAAHKAIKMKPDIIYGRDLLACIYAGIFHPRVGLEYHIPIKSKWGKRICQFFWTRKKTKKFVAISAALKEIYANDMPKLADKILVAHDGGDIVEETPWPTDKRLQVGYVGHLYAGRGVEIIEKMAERCPWADFHIVGGTEKDLAYWQEKVGDRDNLKFYGFLPPSKSEAVRSKCHVLLAPYQWEVTVSGGGNTVKWMSPIKVFEYMATGRAIVISDLPVLYEILTDNETAMFCYPDDVDAWVAALEKLRDDPKHMKALGDNARKVFLDQYSWKRRAEIIFDEIAKAA